MSQQAINTEAIVKERQSSGVDAVRRLLGELLVGIRVDDLPSGEAERLAAEGKFYPLTVNADGHLRVVTPDWIKVQTAELEVLLRIEQLLTEQRDLLLKIA